MYESKAMTEHRNLQTAQGFYQWSAASEIGQVFEWQICGVGIQEVPDGPHGREHDTVQNVDHPIGCLSVNAVQINRTTGGCVDLAREDIARIRCIRV